MRKILILLYLMFAGMVQGFACCVFSMASSDTIIVARNHDSFDESLTGPNQAKYSVQFVPASFGKRGTFYNIVRMNGIQFVMEGMNDAGLYIGGAAVPTVKLVFDNSKPYIDTSGIQRLVLEKCSTVDEAVAMIKEYNLVVYPNSFPGHSLIADASGKSVIL